MVNKNKVSSICNSVAASFLIAFCAFSSCSVSDGVIISAIYKKEESLKYCYLLIRIIFAIFISVDGMPL